MVKVEKLVPGGQGLGTQPDGRKIFLWNALPGEEVAAYTVTKRKARYDEAIATEIAKPAGERVAPRDECYLATSPWQVLDYDFELEQKRELVREVLREHGILVGKPEIVTDGRQYQYRNKMEYALYWERETGEIELAFHARGSHRKVPVRSSALEKPEIWARAQEIVGELNARHEEARKYQSLLLRADQAGKVAGGLYEKGRPHPVFAPLTDRILGHEYRYSPNGFFQINLPVYELALREMRKWVGGERVLDLYAGVGTIGLSVARDRELTLVEADGYAYRELVGNLLGAERPGLAEDSFGAGGSLEGPSGTTFGGSPEVGRKGPAEEVRVETRNGVMRARLAKSEQVLDMITEGSTVILDPPRAGCRPELVEKLVATRLPVVIYLSCNPATQARDLERLLTAYRIEEIKVFNFFPRTPHIENLVVLTRKTGVGDKN